jgi:SAM-dependent methyltransferase
MDSHLIRPANDAFAGLYRIIGRLRLGDRVMKMVALVWPGVGKHAVRSAYNMFNSYYSETDVLFLNYGYAPLDADVSTVALHAEDEPERYCVQLYHRVAGAVDLRSKDILEVGCGRGGGSSFVKRYLGPRAVTGVDLAEKAVEFCRAHHRVQGLSFSPGDAEALPFPPASFDAVLNVESSHCYASMERFLSEVGRVLRARGHLLFGDLRSPEDVVVLREQFRGAGFDILEEEAITRNVLRALDHDSERRLALIHAGIPQALRPLMQDIVGVRDTRIYESFRTGACGYYRFVLRKYG